VIQNNTWIHESESRTVVIFVHGILSNSDSCWRNTKAKSYWPELVRKDPQFEDAAVFVSGYTAGAGAGLYDVRAAAADILALLRNPGTQAAPLDKDRLIFVCHSQGGIVVRQMLVSFFQEFQDKKVGVVLCGSPSWGSWYGTLLAPIGLVFRFRQATALSWGGSTLRNLDRDFLELIEQKRIPNITGSAWLKHGAGSWVFLFPRW
jgi:pimeloyl-ACP methyl ester carboxylesterase